MNALAECAHLAICAMVGNARLGRDSQGLQEKKTSCMYVFTICSTTPEM